MDLTAEMATDARSRGDVAEAQRTPESFKEFEGDDYSFLRQKAPNWMNRGREFRSVDLFCGAGGLTLGASEAVRSLGGRLVNAYAADMNNAAAACFERNFQTPVVRDDLTEIFDIESSNCLTKAELNLRRRLTDIDLLMGGPPCQGALGFEQLFPS